MSLASTLPGRGANVRHHLLTLKVENKAGVLTRIAGLFARRGFNIFSLAVAPTDDDRFSRVSIVVDVESVPLQQVLDQIDKLVNVVEIVELRPEDAREAELLLATVGASGVGQHELGALAERAGASVVDSAEGAVTLMLAGSPGALDDFEDAIRPFGILEIQRTGRIALPTLGPTP